MTDPTPPPDSAPAAPDAFGTRFFKVIAGAAHRLGDAEFPTGERAALRRLDPTHPGGRIAAVCRLLDKCGWDLERTSPDDLRRWTLVLHTLALMSGPGTNPHDPAKPTGGTIADAGLSEARFARLLTARGPAFRDLLPRLARFLAAQHQRLDCAPLAELVFRESWNEERAEQIRLRLAAQYYAARAHQDGASGDRHRETAA